MRDVADATARSADSQTEPATRSPPARQPDIVASAPAPGGVAGLALHAQRTTGNALLSRMLAERTSAGPAADASVLARCPDGSDPDCPCAGDELQDEADAHEAVDAQDDPGRALARAARVRRSTQRTAARVVARQGAGSGSHSPEPPSPSGGGGGGANQSIGAAACLFPIDDVTLFEQLQRTWPIFGKSTEIPLWNGSVDLGWLGWIDISVLAGAEAEASLLTSLGPGVIRDICLDADPANASASGTGTLSIPADAIPDLMLEGSLRGSADYLGRVPLAALAGALRAAATGTAHPEVAVTVKLTYEDGKLTFTAAADLSMALQLTFDLDASLLAELFGEEVWSGAWNLISWRWDRLWNILGKITVGMSDGVGTEPQLELLADEISLEEVMRAVFADLIDAEEIIGGIRGSSVATEVQMLDPMTAVIARASIEAQDYATALDVVVHSLPVDTSLCTIEFIDRFDQGEGLTEAQFDAFNVPNGPAKVSIYTPAFTSVPWLVSSVMHEYQHVLQFQQGLEPGERVGDEKASAIASEAREIEAYLWELEHATETGLVDNPEDLDTDAERLKEHYDALGVLDAKRQKTYAARVEAALETVKAQENCQANDCLGETADPFISRCRRASIRREFPGQLLSETLGNIKRGKSAEHKKAWKLLNDNRFKK